MEVMQLKGRIEKLESTARSKHPSNRNVVLIGYIQRLPAEYQGASHLVVRDRFPSRGSDDWYEWEEVAGPTPNGREADSQRTWIVSFVGREPYRLGDARREREAEAAKGIQ
jgi:hypothetical protein